MWVNLNVGHETGMGTLKREGGFKEGKYRDIKMGRRQQKFKGSRDKGTLGTKGRNKGGGPAKQSMPEVSQ